MRSVLRNADETGWNHDKTSSDVLFRMSVFFYIKKKGRDPGEKISFDDNPYMQAWLSRGWAGKAETLIEHGAPEYKIPAFKDIIKDIGKREHKDFYK